MASLVEVVAGNLTLLVQVVSRFHISDGSGGHVPGPHNPVLLDQVVGSAGEIPVPNRRMQCDRGSIAAQLPAVRRELQCYLHSTAACAQMGGGAVFFADIEHPLTELLGDGFNELWRDCGNWHVDVSPS